MIVKNNVNPIYLPKSTNDIFLKTVSFGHHGWDGIYSAHANPFKAYYNAVEYNKNSEIKLNESNDFSYCINDIDPAISAYFHTIAAVIDKFIEKNHNSIEKRFLNSMEKMKDLTDDSLDYIIEAIALHKQNSDGKIKLKQTEWEFSTYSKLFKSEDTISMFKENFGEKFADLFLNKFQLAEELINSPKNASSTSKAGTCSDWKNFKWKNGKKYEEYIETQDRPKTYTFDEDAFKKYWDEFFGHWKEFFGENRSRNSGINPNTPTSSDYEILGVSKGASADVIKKAYRKKSRQYHPDKNPGDKDAEDMMKKINAAYDRISGK